MGRDIMNSPNCELSKSPTTDNQCPTLPRPLQIARGGIDTSARPPKTTANTDQPLDGLRRSQRISGRSPVTRFFARTRKAKGTKSVKVNSPKSTQKLIQEAELLQALQDETLALNPLQEHHVIQVQQHCSMLPNMDNTAQDSRVQQDGNADLHCDLLLDHDESVLPSLQYDPDDDDLSDGEEEGPDP